MSLWRWLGVYWGTIILCFSVIVVMMQFLFKEKVMIQLWKHKFRCAFCFTFEERDACKLFQMICLRRKLELKHFVLPSCYWRLVIFTVPNWISNVRHIQIQAVTLCPQSFSCLSYSLWGSVAALLNFLFCFNGVLNN